MEKRCTDCTHCKVVAAVLVYCEKGYWQKLDGTQKRISAAFVSRSKLAKQAEYCPDFDSEECAECGGPVDMAAGNNMYCSDCLRKVKDEDC